MGKEEELKKQRRKLEEEALKTLATDLEEQLNSLQASSEKITGKITPYGFE